jgi:hypothetical protein
MLDSELYISGKRLAATSIKRVESNFNSVSMYMTPPLFPRTDDVSDDLLSLFLTIA